MLKIGQKVYSGLYGGRYGYIYQIDGEQKPNSVARVGVSFGMTGGNAKIQIVFNNGTKSSIPECIIHGVQWKIFDEFINPEELAVKLKFAEDEEIRKKEEAQQAAKQRLLDIEAVKKEYHYLTPLISDTKMTAVKNIRTLLKHRYPKTKFSVTSTHGAVRIAYENGASYDEIDKIGGMFEEGKFNGMEDIYEYKSTPFTDTFGGIRYVFVNRALTEDKLQEILTDANLRYDKQYDLESYLTNRFSPEEEHIRQYIYKQTNEKNFY